MKGFLTRLILNNTTINGEYKLGGYKMIKNNNTLSFYKTRPKTNFSFNNELTEVCFCKVSVENDRLNFKTNKGGVFNNSVPLEITGNEREQILNSCQILHNNLTTVSWSSQYPNITN